MNDTSAILGRINDALRERAMTQVELAEQAGLSTTQMSRLLSGQRKVTAGELGVLADALGVSPSALLGRSEPAQAWGAPAWLVQAGCGELADLFVRAQHLVELRARLDELLAPGARASGVDVDIPTSAHAAAAGRQLAKRVRKALKLGDEPVGDLTALVEDVFGLDVATQPMPDSLHGLLVTGRVDQFSGDAAAPARGSSPGAVALINSGDTWGRQRFTLARELAHLLFMDVRLFVADFAGRPVRDLNELRADCFAAHFLAPDSGLRAVARALTGAETAPGRPLADVDGAGGAALVAAVAVRFGLSAQVSTRRLEDTRVIDASQSLALERRTARELFLEAGCMRQWDEQGALQYAVVPPPGLLARALYAYREGMLSVQALADLYGTADVAALEGELASAGWRPAPV